MWFAHASKCSAMSDQTVYFYIRPKQAESQCGCLFLPSFPTDLCRYSEVARHPACRFSSSAATPVHDRYVRLEAALVHRLCKALGPKAKALLSDILQITRLWGRFSDPWGRIATKF